MDKNDYQSRILKSMTSILRQEIEDKGGSFEFMESITITGRYGDKAGTKYLFIKDGKLYAHIFSAWCLENPEACIEYESSYLHESCLKYIINRVRNDYH